MTDQPHEPVSAPATAPQVLVAGFGLPGRSIAEQLDLLNIEYSVIEMNEDVAKRCHRRNRQIVVGDATDPQTLIKAGLKTVKTVALMMPVDSAVLHAVSAVRTLRPDVYIIARTAFTSVGMEAHRLGANEIIVAEQVVATYAEQSILRRISKDS
jgi:voltage-gated potassium channel